MVEQARRIRRRGSDTTSVCSSIDTPTHCDTTDDNLTDHSNKDFGEGEEEEGWDPAPPSSFGYPDDAPPPLARTGSAASLRSAAGDARGERQRSGSGGGRSPPSAAAAASGAIKVTSEVLPGPRTSITVVAPDRKGLLGEVRRRSRS
jgi:hypothetical protein